MTQRKKFMFQ